MSAENPYRGFMTNPEAVGHSWGNPAMNEFDPASFVAAVQSGVVPPCEIVFLEDPFMALFSWLNMRRMPEQRYHWHQPWIAVHGPTGPVFVRRAKHHNFFITDPEAPSHVWRRELECALVEDRQAPCDCGAEKGGTTHADWCSRMTDFVESK